MTITTKTNQWVYDGDGASVLFPYTNWIEAASDMLVYITDKATGDAVQLAYPLDFAVDGVGLADGGNVTLAVAPATGNWVVLVRDVQATQEADFEARRALPAEVIEGALDKLTSLDQQDRSRGSRSIRQVVSDPWQDMVLPSCIKLRGKMLAFTEDTGQPMVSSLTLAEIEGGAASAAESAAEAEASAAAAAASETNAAASATAAEASKDEAAVQAFNATTQAGLASASAAAAAGSATAADASADAAAISEANAATAGATAGAAAGSAAATALVAWTNVRLAKAAAYAVVNADKGKTIACSAAPWALTFGAAAGYDANFAVAVVNESTTRAIRVVVGGGTDFWLYPLQTAWLFNNNSVWVVDRPIRWKLPAATTVYVDVTNGNDNNDGLAAGAGNALQGWFAWRARIGTDLDFNGQTLTVQFAAGTYTAGSISLSGSQSWDGGGRLAFLGDTTTPANVVLQVTSGACFSLAGPKPGLIQIGGFKLTTITAGNLVDLSDGVQVNINGKMDFGAAAWGHMSVNGGAALKITASYTISGGGSIHLDAGANGTLQTSGALTVTFSGTPTFGNQFVRSYAGGMIGAANLTFSGTFTGQRYNAFTNGVIDTATANVNYFPGTVAGAVATGGQYV